MYPLNLGPKRYGTLQDKLYVSDSLVGISGSGKLYSLGVLDNCIAFSFCYSLSYFYQFVVLIPSVVFVIVVLNF